MTYLSRATATTLVASTVAGIQDNLAQIQSLQDQLSTGYRVNRPSDSPSDAVIAMTSRADIRRVNQYQRNTSDGLDFLGTADNTLQSILDYAHQARALLLQGTNGTLDAQGRSAVADQVDAIRQSLLSLANTEYLGRPIFGGTVAGSQAYDTGTGSYVGDNGAVSRTVASGTTVQLNMNGPAVFGPAGSSLFDVLTQISADLRNPATVGNLTSSDLANLDAATNSVTAALSEVGVRYNRLQAVKNSNDTVLATLQNRLSAAEDVDMAKTISDLQLQQVAYQASLSVGAKVLQNSLVDFLR